jgi:hypothetical protein
MISEALPVIVASGEGEKLYAFGEEVIVHLGGAQTEAELLFGRRSLRNLKRRRYAADYRHRRDHGIHFLTP